MFKDDFLWGAASAAYQIEGAFRTDGKGVSVWDVWAHEPGKTYAGTNGDVAADHYHRMEEDVRLMAEMGLKAYRFSFAWTRILPEGRGPVNTSGIAFYNRLIDRLLEADIVPLVTLYHWDLPQALQEEYGGWISRRIVEDFEAYAEVCFKAFGDRVKHWIVINEPNIFTHQGYMLGIHPPGIKDEKAYLQAYHHTALAHAKAVLKYKALGQDGIIGSSIAFSPAYARSGSSRDAKALENYYATGPWYFMDIYYRGVYPKEAVAYYQSHGITLETEPEDDALLKVSAGLVDFIGINYYQTALIAHNPLDGVGTAVMNTSGKKGSQKESGVPGLYKFVKNDKLEYTDWDWAIDPDGMRYGLLELQTRYGLPLLISENGLGFFDRQDAVGAVRDTERIRFLDSHISACGAAIEAGVDLLGYCVWSFTDLLSWLNGYRKRYGLVHIDYEGGTLKRTPKASYHWYGKVIEKQGCLPLETYLSAQMSEHEMEG